MSSYFVVNIFFYFDIEKTLGCYKLTKEVNYAKAFNRSLYGTVRIQFEAT